MQENRLEVTKVVALVKNGGKSTKNATPLNVHAELRRSLGYWRMYISPTILQVYIYKFVLIFYLTCKKNQVMR